MGTCTKEMILKPAHPESLEVLLELRALPRHNLQGRAAAVPVGAEMCRKVLKTLKRRSHHQRPAPWDGMRQQQEARLWLAAVEIGH